MVDRNSLFDRRNSREVNPTVEGSDDRPPSDDSLIEAFEEEQEKLDQPGEEE